MSMVMCLIGLGVAARGIARKDRMGSGLAVLGAGMIAKGVMDTEGRFNPSQSHRPAPKELDGQHPKSNGHGSKGRRRTSATPLLPN